MGNSSEANYSENIISDKLFTKKHHYFYIVSSLEIISALILNFLFLAVMIRLRSRITVSSNMYVIMCSLSGIDIIKALAFGGNNHVRDFLIQDYTTQYKICKYSAFLISTSLAGNIYHVLLMSIDTYVAVALPLR